MNMNIEIVVVIVLQSESHTMSSRNSLLMPRLHGLWTPTRPVLSNSFLIMVCLRCLKMRNERH